MIYLADTYLKSVTDIEYKSVTHIVKMEVICYDNVLYNTSFSVISNKAGDSILYPFGCGLQFH